MNRTITVAAVRKSIKVAASPDREFHVFTAGMSRWWNKSYSINKSPIKDNVIEPKAGGRWFEGGEDGSECEWGKVVAWEPPVRLRLAWQITQSWSFDPDLLTELDVRFIADGTGTRVELGHRLDGYGADAEQVFQIFDSPEGWGGLLDRFAREAG
jgi:uncharacterized protein YndB with AHSA1/START domain